MKNIFLLLSIISLLAACHLGSDGSSTDSSLNTTSTSLASRSSAPRIYLHNKVYNRVPTGLLVIYDNKNSNNVDSFSKYIVAPEELFYQHKQEIKLSYTFSSAYSVFRPDIGILKYMLIDKLHALPKGYTKVFCLNGELKNITLGIITPDFKTAPIRFANCKTIENNGQTDYYWEARFEGF